MFSLHTNRVQSLLFILLIVSSVFFKVTIGYTAETNQDDNNKSQEKVKEHQQKITSITPVLRNTLSHSDISKNPTKIDNIYYHQGENGNSVLVTRSEEIANVWLRKEQNFELMGITKLVNFIRRVNFNKDGSQLCIVPDIFHAKKRNDYYMELYKLSGNFCIREKIYLDVKLIYCQCFNPVDNNELFIIQDGMIIIFKHDDIKGWQEKERIGGYRDSFYENDSLNNMGLGYTAQFSANNVFRYGCYGFDGQTIILTRKDGITILTRNHHGGWDINNHELKDVLALAHSSTQNEFISITKKIRSLPYLGGFPSSKNKAKIQQWYLNSNGWQYTQLAEFLADDLECFHFSPDQNGFFLGFEDNTATVFNKDKNNNFLISEIKNWYPFYKSTLHFSPTPYSNDGKTIFVKDKSSPLLMNQGNTWIDPLVSLKSEDSSKLLSLQMSDNNKRLISVFVTPYEGKAKYEVQLLLKDKLDSFFSLESTMELNESVSKAFFIDNSHFAVVHRNDVKIYEIPAAIADNEVAEASME